MKLTEKECKAENFQIRPIDKVDLYTVLQLETLKLFKSAIQTNGCGTEKENLCVIFHQGIFLNKHEFFIIPQ